MLIAIHWPIDELHVVWAIAWITGPNRIQIVYNGRSGHRVESNQDPVSSEMLNNSSKRSMY